MKKYSIVIPTYNHCNELLKPCLESIANYTDLDNIEIIIVANGCTDNTKEYVSSLTYPIKLIWFDEPLGYTKATNIGIQNALGEFIILLNNDVEILTSEKNAWINQLEESFIQDKLTAIAGPLSLWDKDVQSNFIVFWCAMIKKEIFQQIGILDEIFNPGYGEDIDFAVRALKAGFKIKSLDDITFKNGTNTGNFPIWHKNNKTFGQIKEYKSYIVNRNKLTLRNRYNPPVVDTSNIKIGVITPTFNDQQFIKSSINSVKLQTIKNIHHYIYNDASTDDTKLILDEYSSDTYFHVIHGTHNLGQSYARNQLIKEALKDQCTHIALLDADDTWTIDHIELSLAALNSNDIVYSTPHFVDQNDSTLFPINIPIPQMFIGKQLMHNNFIWISSVLAKSDCFKENTFDSNLNSIEDWDMWYRLNQQGYKFVNKKDLTTYYLIKQNGAGSFNQTKHNMFRNKHKTLSSLKLHLGCGDEYDDDYINVDFYIPEDKKIDARFDILSIPYPDNSVDEIKAFHVIEHFDFFEIQKILKEWNRVLKPGGKLYVETPDFLSTCDAFVKGSEEFRIFLYNQFFGHNWFPGGAHKFLFTENQLRVNLDWAGFKNVIRVAPASKYVQPATTHLFLTVEAYK
jgi:GT2 family glycosyltransferase/predicted SAM-dependent methyltransferase